MEFEDSFFQIQEYKLGKDIEHCSYSYIGHLFFLLYECQNFWKKKFSKIFIINKKWNLKMRSSKSKTIN